MKDSRRFMYRCFSAVLLLLSSSCSFQRPSDLRLEKVFVADLTPLTHYERNVILGYTQPIGLVIELSSTETYELGAYVLDGFCGEKLELAGLREGTLYKSTHKEENEGVDGRHMYYVLAVIKSYVVPGLPKLPDFDLDNDNRDLCLKTGFSESYVGYDSNIVRVPRSLIDKALREGAKPPPPIN